MKFWQQFEVNQLYACTKYQGYKLSDFGFRIQKPLQKFGMKSGLIQKTAQVRQKIFHIVKCFKIPLYLNQFGRDEVFSFFFSFFSS